MVFGEIIDPARNKRRLYRYKCARMTYTCADGMQVPIRSRVIQKKNDVENDFEHPDNGIVYYGKCDKWRRAAEVTMSGLSMDRNMATILRSMNARTLAFPPTTRGAARNSFYFDNELLGLTLNEGLEELPDDICTDDRFKMLSYMKVLRVPKTMKNIGQAIVSNYVWCRRIYFPQGILYVRGEPVFDGARWVSTLLVYKDVTELEYNALFAQFGVS